MIDVLTTITNVAAAWLAVGSCAIPRWRAMFVLGH